MPRSSRIQVRRYLILGGLAFSVEYASFSVMYYVLGWNVNIANAASFTLALITSFAGNRAWTFRSGNYAKNVLHQFILYVSLALINLALTLGIVALLQAANVQPMYGKLIAMALTSLWNFAIFKFKIFSAVTVATADADMTSETAEAAASAAAAKNTETAANEKSNNTESTPPS